MTAASAGKIRIYRALRHHGIGNFRYVWAVKCGGHLYRGPCLQTITDTWDEARDEAIEHLHAHGVII